MGSVRTERGPRGADECQLAEALTATAAAGCVGIDDVEASLVQTIFVVKRCALKQLCRRWVDKHANTLTKLALLVVGGDVAIEKHLIRKSAAATWAHGDAQGEVFCAFSGEQFLDFFGCGIGKCDHWSPPGERLLAQRYRLYSAQLASETLTNPNRLKFPMNSAHSAPPTRDDIFGLLTSVIDPELGSDIVTLGMVPDIVVSPQDSLGGVDVTVWIKLTIGGCPLRSQIKKDVETRVATHPLVRQVHIEWGEMTSDERSQVMLKARWSARESAPDTEVPQSCRILAIASGKGGVGKSSVTVNLAAALALQGFTVGVLDADIWGFSVPRLLGISDRLEAQPVEGSDKPKIIPNTIRVGRGQLKVVSTGFLVGEDTALMWRGLMLTKAVEQFLRDVAWGDMDYLLIDMPPGTGDVQMGLARMLPRTDMIIVTTPALAAQKVAARAADMARRSFLRVVGVIENMSSFTCEHGHSYALFGVGGGQSLADEIGVPLLGQVPLEPAVSAAGDAGSPVALRTDSGAAGQVFRDIAQQIIDDIAPPVNMAGCSARMLAAVSAAFDQLKQPAS